MALIDAAIQIFWALFFVLYGLWLVADRLAGTSIVAKNAALCCFILLVTGARYVAPHVLRDVVKSRFKSLRANEPDASKGRDSTFLKEPWFPREKMRFLLCLCAAAILIYFANEVRSRWTAEVLSLSTLIALHFAQTPPGFHPFRWWTLLALPISGLCLGWCNSPLSYRAPVLSIALGTVGLISGTKLLIRSQTGTGL